MAHDRLTTRCLYSRALPLAVIVFMMTVLGCGLGDWERPIGKHGYQLIDHGGGIVLANSSGSPITPGFWRVSRLLSDDEWLLVELRDAAQSNSLSARYMVVNMPSQQVWHHPAETVARAALPTNLQSRALREPSVGGLLGVIRDLGLVIIIGGLVLGVLIVRRVDRGMQKRHRLRTAATHPAARTPGPSSE